MTIEELEKKYLDKRVAVYRGAYERSFGVVRGVDRERLHVVLDGNENMYDVFHPKQVRILKKKERRKAWVALPKDPAKMPHVFDKKPETKNDAGGFYIRVNNIGGFEWVTIKELIEFVEVKKK